MDKAYIIPFVKSIQNLFDTMLQMAVQVKDPVLKQPGQPSYDVSAIIGMSGQVEGTVVLSFPTEVSEKVVTKFTGMEITSDEDDFCDALGELVNMVVGAAKAQFPGEGVSISCPSVVIGSDHMIFGRKDVMCIVIPCQCECGDFAVEVSMKTPAPTTSDTAAQATAG